jgi:type II secretory pathway pseudopilin PulG
MQRRSHLARRSLQHGFTLTELMVALSGGMLITIAAFALARDTSRFYQAESRYAAAGVNSLLGFQRLRNDVARAGYLSTPNVLADRDVCGFDASTWPTAMRSLSSALITKGAGVAPDTLRIAGALTSPEEFPVSYVVAAGAGFQVSLASNSGALARNGLTLPELQRTFANGRILRIVDPTGLTFWGVISGVTAGSARDANGNVITPVTVSLAQSPGIALLGSGNVGGICQLVSSCTSCTANVVNIVEYRVRSLFGVPGFETLIPVDDRVELTREELDAAGAAIPGTLELVAEYAANFKIGVTATTAASFSTGLTTLAPDNANAGQFSQLTNAALGPQRLRSLRLQLGTRVRGSTGDRTGDAPDPGYRVAMPDGTFARVRTLQADVTLRNQAAVASW